MVETTIKDCTLRIDPSRGVIYVDGPNDETLLRICRLPVPIPAMDVYPTPQLDITHMVGASWVGKD